MYVKFSGQNVKERRISDIFSIRRHRFGWCPHEHPYLRPLTWERHEFSRPYSSTPPTSTRSFGTSHPPPLYPNHSYVSFVIRPRQHYTPVDRYICIRQTTPGSRAAGAFPGRGGWRDPRERRSFITREHHARRPRGLATITLYPCPSRENAEIIRYFARCRATVF